MFYRPGDLRGRASFYRDEAASQRVSDHCFIGEIQREQYRGNVGDNATDGARDIFHFHETKEEYFGMNITNSFSRLTSLVLNAWSLVRLFLVENVLEEGPPFWFLVSHDIFLMVIGLTALREFE